MQILGIETVDGKRETMYIPAEATVTVISGPKPNDERLLDLLYEGRTLTAFAEDIQARAEEIAVRRTVA